MFELEAAVRAWRRELAAERTLSTDQLDELEDHVRAQFQWWTGEGLPPARAWHRARAALGAPAELSAEFRKVEGVAWHRLLMLGWVVHGLSFLLPAHRFQLGAGERGIAGWTLEGLSAFWLALSGEAGAVGVVSALTNAAMVATLWRIRDRGRRALTALAGVVTGACFLNLWWMTQVDSIAELRVGYFLWWASFGLASAGLLLRARALHGRELPLTTT